MVPEAPRENRAGAQGGEEEGEEAVLEVVEPGGVGDETGGDGDGDEHEEEGYGEYRPVRREMGGMLRVLSLLVYHAGP